MARFKDSAGREWSIVMTIGMARRLKKEFDLDFVSALYDSDKAYQIIGELYQKPELFCQLIHYATGTDMDIEEFWEPMTGEDLAEAFETLDQSFTDFYPPAKREKIAQMKEKLKAALEAGQEDLMPELEAKMETQIREGLRQAAGLTSTPGK
ncbi:hypothetical protein [Paremcibacter congregatus]|uniref:hypothetical protein n=1 Tax=Paremcibacter congregatus TaxID=2043170 RepID=UPI003A93355C